MARAQEKSKEGRCSQKACSLNEEMVYLWSNLRVRGELTRCSVGRADRELNRSWRRAKCVHIVTTRGARESVLVVMVSSRRISPLSPLSSLHFPPDLSSSPSGSFLLFTFLMLSCAFPHTASPSSLVLGLPALSFSFPQVLASVYRLSFFPSLASPALTKPMWVSL